MKPQDFSLLEIPVCADAAMLQEAFRMRAWELHPDVCLLPDSAQKFMSLKEAYGRLRVGLHSENVGGSPSLVAAWYDSFSLKRILRSTATAQERACALRRLVHDEKESSVPFVMEALRAGEPVLSWAAIHCLGKLNAKSAFPRLCLLFPNSVSALRFGMLRFAKSLGGNEASAMYRKGLSDPLNQIRTYCRQMLEPADASPVAFRGAAYVQA